VPLGHVRRSRKFQEHLRNCPQLPETPFRRESAPTSSTLVECVNAVILAIFFYRFLSNYDEIAHDLDAGRGSHSKVDRVTAPVLVDQKLNSAWVPKFPSDYSKVMAHSARTEYCGRPRPVLRNSSPPQGPVATTF
jgi:hypothetical protein